MIIKNIIIGYLVLMGIMFNGIIIHELTHLYQLREDPSTNNQIIIDLNPKTNSFAHVVTNKIYDQETVTIMEIGAYTSTIGLTMILFGITAYLQEKVTENECS
jgi:hypothetical protein